MRARGTSPARVLQGDAHRGRRGQARVRIGRDVVEEGSGGRRACMQGLGFGSRAPTVSRRLCQQRRPPQLPL
jgi:hypothetical protein